MQTVQCFNKLWLLSRHNQCQWLHTKPFHYLPNCQIPNVSISQYLADPMGVGRGREGVGKNKSRKRWLLKVHLLKISLLPSSIRALDPQWTSTCDVHVLYGLTVQTSLNPDLVLAVTIINYQQETYYATKSQCTFWSPFHTMQKVFWKQSNCRKNVNYWEFSCLDSSQLGCPESDEIALNWPSTVICTTSI